MRTNSLRSKDGLMVRSIAICWLLSVLVQNLWAQGQPDIFWMAGGHQGSVNAVAVSPNGNLIASGSSDNTVKLWSAVTGALIRTLEGHTNTVRSVTFSPNGQFLVSGSADGTVRCRRVSDGAVLRIFTGHGDVYSVSVAPNNNLIAATAGNQVYLWRLSDGALVRIFYGATSTIYSVNFSPNGELLVAGGNDRSVRVWRVSNGSLIRTLTGHTSAINAVAFSPDGTVIASGSGDRTIRIWNADSGALVRSLSAHTSIVRTLCFAANGTLLVSGSDDRSIRIWRVSDGAALSTAQGHTDSVLGVAASLSGQWLASASRDRTVRLWRINDGAQIARITGHTDAVQTVAFSPDGALVASAGSDQTIRVRRVSDGELVAVLTGHTGIVWGLAFSPDGSLLASASNDRTVRLWNVSTWQTLRTLSGHTDIVYAVSFSPDGTLLATGSRDRTIRIWNVADGSSVATWSGHTGSVLSVAFSPEGNLLASGGSDNTVRIWFAANGGLLRTIQQHTSQVNAVAFSPDGTVLASASNDNSVRLWRVPSGDPIRTLSGHTNDVRALAFSPEGSILFSAGLDSTVRLWRVADGTLLEAYDREMTGGVNALAVSSDDQFFAYGRADATTVVATNPYGELGFRIRFVIPNRVFQLPSVVTQVVGSGFEPGATVFLVREGQPMITPTTLRRLSAYRLSATFNFVNAAPGRYTVVVRNPDGREAVLENALEVREGQGEPELFHYLETPTAVRPNRDYVATLTYRNIGQAPMNTPIVIVSSPENLLMRLSPNEPYRRAPLVVLAIGDNAANRLAPGDGGTIQIHFRSPTARDTFRINYQFQKDDNDLVDWNLWGARMRPTSVEPQVWSRVFNGFVQQIGTRWSDFNNFIRTIAQEQFTNGVRVNSVETLLSFAFEHFVGFSSPFARVADSADLIIATEPETLTLRRTMPIHLYARFTKGVFGYGWQHNHDYRLQRLSEEEILLLQPGGGVMRFYRAPRGGWASSAGRSVQLEEIRSGGVFEGYLIRSQGGTTWRFDTEGRITQRIVQRGTGVDITQYEYNGMRLSRILHSGGVIVQFQYNAQGRVARAETNYGDWMQYIYDATGDHLVQVISSTGMQCQYAYHPEDGSLKSHAITEIRGERTVVLDYDSFGRITYREVVGSCDQVQFRYPGWAIHEVTTSEGTERKVYFADGTYLSRSSGGFTIRTQRSGNQFAFIFPDGSAMTYDLDARGAPVAVRSPSGATIRTVYNPNTGLLERVVNPKGVEYRLRYTANSTTIQFPDGTQQRAVISDNGRRTEVTLRSGRRGEMVTDNANRVIQFRTAERTISYTYDSRGNMLTATDSVTGTIQMSYNERDKLRRIQYPNGAWIEYDYDAQGNRTRMRFHTGDERRYFYDAFRRLARVEDGNGRLIVAYEYGSACRLTRALYGNGASTSYTYTMDGLPLRIEHRNASGAVIDFCEYVYDLMYRPVAIRTPSGVYEYAYDRDGQVVGFRRPGHDVAYIYDPAGNRIATRVNGITTQYTVNTLDQYTRIGNATYTYDADGNLVRVVSPQGTYTIEYDSFGRVRRVNTPEGVAEYEYDALGHRYMVRYNGQTRYHIHDPVYLGNLVAELDANGSLLTRYDHYHGLVSMSNASGIYYYHGDALRNIRVLTGSGGTIVNRYEYGAFGEPLVVQETVPNPFRFVGGEGVMTEPTGLVYMRARQYDPSTGRFVSPDPLLFEAEVNFYRYSANAPSYNSDPTGLFVIPIMILHDPFPPLQPCPTKPEPPNGCTGVPRFVSNYLGFTDCCNDHDRAYSLGGSSKDRRIADEEFYRCMKEVANRTGRRSAHIAAPIFYGAVRLFGPFFFNECYKDPPTPPDGPGNGGGGGGGRVLRPIDPNEKRGPVGFGGQGWIRQPDGSLTYDIYFENLPTATAWAQEVVITDVLDPDLDRSTFELLDIQVANQVVDDLVGLQSGRVIVPMQDSDLLMDISVEFNAASGLVRWVIRSLDPVTGDLPPEVDRGLLPPNDPQTGSGEGRVSFRIRPRANRLAHGSQYTNQARIVFDEEAAIDTNIWVNTIDAIAPTARAVPRAYAGSSPVRINWTGTDIGSGIKDYTVLVSFNGEPYQVWLENTTETSATFTPSESGVYIFAVVARDNVGNRGNVPFIPVDINGDGCVDDSDLLLVLFNFGATGTDLPTDINGDGVVDDADLLVVLFSFGRGCR